MNSAKRVLAKVRSKLQTRLKNGFWFPIFQNIVQFLYTRLSLNSRLKVWLTNGDRAPRGVSELYQLILILLALLWLTFIDHAPHPLFQTDALRIVGIAIALYVVTELFLFCLSWIFVDEKDLHSFRRSLAGFILNLFQIALYFSITFRLIDCSSPPNVWDLVYNDLRAVFQLQLAITTNGTTCSILSHYQVVIASTILVIIIASLVGTVLREEKEDRQQ